MHGATIQNTVARWIQQVAYGVESQDERIHNDIDSSKPSGSNMFATRRAKERRTSAVLVVIYDYAWHRVVVPSYLLSPVSAENHSTT